MVPVPVCVVLKGQSKVSPPHLMIPHEIWLQNPSRFFFMFDVFGVGSWAERSNSYLVQIFIPVCVYIELDADVLPSSEPETL